MNFITVAKAMETKLDTIAAASVGDESVKLQREIRDLQEELAVKDALIDKFTTKSKKWEEKFTAAASVDDATH